MTMTRSRTLPTLVALALGLALGLRAPAHAQTAPPTTDAPQASMVTLAPETPAGEALTRLVAWLNGSPIESPETFFDEAFLRAIPIDRLNEGRATLVDKYFGPGPITLAAIEQQLGTHELDAVAVGSSGQHIRIRMGLDPTTGLLNRLNFAPAPELDDTTPKTWPQLIEALRALPGTVGFGAWEVTTSKEGSALGEIATLNPDTDLAIGSAFKLYVLGALGEQVAAGQRAWLDTIEVDEALKSLPSGTMQTLPAGTTLTLDAVALDMIRISDNTATDHLIALLGRDAVEDYTRRFDPDAAAWFPFLMTREMFRLKLTGDQELMDGYAGATTEQRREMLAPGGPVQSAEPNLTLAAVWNVPLAIDRIEWFASAHTLARLHAELARMGAEKVNEPLARALRDNPGIPFKASDWTDIAYKGGSEPGVLCLAWKLTRTDGRHFVLILTWNDTQKNVDTEALLKLAMVAADMLASHP